MAKRVDIIPPDRRNAVIVRLTIKEAKAYRFAAGNSLSCPDFMDQNMGSQAEAAAARRADQKIAASIFDAERKALS
jgi:hypothetical protein